MIKRAHVPRERERDFLDTFQLEHIRASIGRGETLCSTRISMRILITCVKLILSDRGAREEILLTEMSRYCRLYLTENEIAIATVTPTEK